MIKSTSLQDYEKEMSMIRAYISVLQQQSDAAPDLYQKIDINKQIGKCAAKVFDILKLIKSNINENEKPLNSDQKHILTHYGKRISRDNEQKRKEDYIGNFKYEESNAYNLVKQYNNNKIPKDDLLRGFLRSIEKQEGIKLHRESLRSKAGLFKFIEEHIDLVRKLFENGTRLECDD